MVSASAADRRAAGRLSTADLVVEVVQDAESFDSLGPAWEELYEAAPRATPFQTHAWLSSWWHCYGQEGRLAVHLVREGDRLLAAFPLEVRRAGPFRVLAPLGGAVSDFSDMLLAERDIDRSTDEVLDALVGALTAVDGWDVIELPEVRPGAAVKLLADRWSGRAWRTGASTCMELQVRSFADVLSRLPGKRARELRRVLRRSDELGLVVTDMSRDEVPGMVRELLALHEQQWQGRGGNPEHQRPRYARHLTAALSTMVERGQAAIVRYELEGRVLAGQVELIGHDLLGGYFLGVAPELYTRMDFSSYVVRGGVERSARLGLTTFSMLRGTEPYKDRWEPTAVTNERLVLVRPRSVRALAFDRSTRVRTWLAAEARTRLPALRAVRQRLRSRRQARGGQARARARVDH